MIVIVYTLTLTIGDLQVDLKFYHSLCLPSSDRVRVFPLRRRLASVNVKRLHKGRRPQYNHLCSRDTHRNLGHLPALSQLHIDLNGLCAPLDRKLGKKYRQLTAVTSSNPLEDQQRLNHDSPPDSTVLQKPVVNDEGIVNGFDEGSVNAGWGPQQLAVWLQANRYGPHIHTLSTFSGADLLRLSKDNLVQLCGLPDGIRLFNILHARPIVPKLTLYICVDPRERVYQAVYLTCLTSSELVAKVCAVLGIHASQVASMFVEGPTASS
uniref:Uncharacterized protein n=1 Tax=Lygus hesperus TaxID=30085 RepID=A0A0K8SX54_LYGHE